MKTVVVFVTNLESGRTHIETTKVGMFQHYKSAHDFIKELTDLYKKDGKSRFEITDVVIG